VRFESQTIPQTSHRSYLFSHQPIAPEIQEGGNIGQVIITVKDTGPGLSPDQQLTLFREGVQFNPNQLQGGQGSGLGLWISREIVSLHGGVINVTSEGLGQGSCFDVRLPVRFANALDDLPSPSMNSQAQALGRYQQPLKPPPLDTVQQPPSAFFSPCERYVLVVDDAASNRKLVSRLLTKKGFVCHEAENGLKCVEKVLAGDVSYEFIVLDYEMPVMDGPSAARQLRESRVATLIIGVTGNVLPEDFDYFLKQGANAVLAKPVSIDDLLEKVRFLQQQQQV
jgi:two-component system, sensor histidine kinase